MIWLNDGISHPGLALVPAKLEETKEEETRTTKALFESRPGQSRAQV
jgi:hypothetical protein